MDALLDGLNPAQKSAVTNPASVVQVLAPPGSGKTKTLTSRVAYLINHNRLQPWNIIVCTFTIKAAREMKERIRGFVGEGIEAKLILGTFHSVARRFLVRYGNHIGIEKNFGIADTSDTLAIIKRIVKRQRYGVEPGVARSRISGLKARSTSVEQFAATNKKAEQHEFAALYAEYEETLKTSNLLDYDDLLLRCTDLLRKHPECVSSIQAVLIDEFQDTNHVQYELMTLLSQKQKCITIVGDPDQSIYGFRSAEIKNLKLMREHHPETVVIHLENNYRSSGCILTSALAVIEQDESRHNKPLLPTHVVGERPVLRKLPNAVAEAKWLVSEIQRSKTLTGEIFTFNDYAILLRSAALSRLIETQLGKAGIPYRMVGGHRFYDRVEVKLVLDYLRVVNQPDHNDALVRIINNPPRKIGEVTVKALLEEAEAQKMTLWDLVLNQAQGRKRPRTKLSAQAEKGIDMFVNLILTSRKKLLNEDGKDCSLVDIIAHVLNKLSFQEFLRKTYREEWEGRWANVEELVAQATDVALSTEAGDNALDESLPVVEGIEQRTLSSGDILTKFLSNVALSTEVEKKDGQRAEQVTISTIHAAKGLEWPVVFIPAAYEGSIPHSRSEDTDEERRLLYVGMTRAQALLYLSCPTKNSQREQTTISPFVTPKNVARSFDIRGPSFGFQTTQDLSHILRRACPAGSIIQHARTLVEHVEDDVYPLDGEDIDPESNYWDIDDQYSDAFPSDFPSKRRKFETAKATTMTTSTMQSTSQYSISNTTLPSSGFVSATAHMKVLQETAAAQKFSTAKEYIPKKLQREDSGTSKAAGASTKRSTKRPAGQGSIKSFFNQSSAIPKELTGKPTHLVEPSQHSPGFSSTFQQPPLNDISNLRKQTVTSKPVYVPPTISTHRPRNQPLVGKPRRTDEEEVGETNRYILLSSSPGKPEEGNDANVGNGASYNTEPPSPTEILSETVSTIAASSAGFRPASTLHTTSMSTLTSSTAPQRKTLGMRRSLQGWSVKSHQPPRPK
ncbi:ATP-depentend DNA helicase-like protein [Mytilinidion resinicola]|uniref:DNA 3'-5' helicase n=1 Tax=Mytilinidion resinicola TaxID=574789 RepID=A0A6A6Z285_9PEZI|nr:ATP-depentend DNA helicase-like protein [Mytilinidion resinicola]KAF2815246.1 ATP-depentend DNA helicase-like protein [Mytilinidion resinicola]